MIPDIAYDFSAEIWLYQGQAAWHFITLPIDVAAHIRGLLTGPRRGWGSVRVAATIGGTTWKTSIFPTKETNSFILPLKASVRKAEHLQPGDSPAVHLQILE